MRKLRILRPFFVCAIGADPEIFVRQSKFSCAMTQLWRKKNPDRTRKIFGPGLSQRRTADRRCINHYRQLTRHSFEFWRKTIAEAKLESYEKRRHFLNVRKPPGRLVGLPLGRRGSRDDDFNNLRFSPQNLSFCSFHPPGWKPRMCGFHPGGVKTVRGYKKASRPRLGWLTPYTTFWSIGNEPLVLVLR